MLSSNPISMRYIETYLHFSIINTAHNKHRIIHKKKFKTLKKQNISICKLYNMCVVTRYYRSCVCLLDNMFFGIVGFYFFFFHFGWFYFVIYLENYNVDMWNTYAQIYLGYWFHTIKVYLYLQIFFFFVNIVVWTKMLFLIFCVERDLKIELIHWN